MGHSMGKFQQHSKQHKGGEFAGTFSKNTSVCLARSERLHCAREGVVCAFGAWGGCVEHAAGGGNRIARAKGGLRAGGRREPPGRYWCCCTKMLLSMTITKTKTMAETNTNTSRREPPGRECRWTKKLFAQTNIIFTFHNTLASQFAR